MIPIARPILGNDELAAVKEVLASGMLTQGPKVTAFEDAFAKEIGRRHGIAVANGTAALHIAGGTGRFKGAAGQGVLIGAGTFVQEPKPDPIEGKSPSLPLVEGHGFDLRLVFLLTLTGHGHAPAPVASPEEEAVAAQ